MSHPHHAVRSWYGLLGEINIENELWHRVKVGSLPLPHPPLVNLILRGGMPLAQRIKQSFLHEFGHLQTFPIALFHAGLLLLLWMISGRRTRMSGMRLAAGAIANHSAWELFSESYVVQTIGREYFETLEAPRTQIRHTLFWQGMMTLTAITSYLFIRGTNPRINREKEGHI
jgi:hypothetical protein